VGKASVYGTSGYDTVSGTAASEMIYGTGDSEVRPGTGTRDTLFGGGGDDIFVLGDARGLFYQDYKANSSGRADHAFIKDFSAGDKIQLVGAMSDYLLHRETIGGAYGTSIFRDDNRDGKVDSLDEYIAHVSGSPEALMLTIDHFVFA
jgi:Ca2+-binding RTX toxin-like protein